MSLLAKIEAFFTNAGTTIDAELTPWEHSFMKSIENLMKSVENNGEQQLLDLAQTEVETTLPAIIANGGDPVPALLASVPTVVKQLQNDVHADVQVAATGALAIAAANLTAAASTAPAPAPAPDPAPATAA